MKIVLSVLTFLTFAFAISVSAQNNADAAKLLEMKQYTAAKSAFISNLKQGNQVTDLFNLGRIYSILNKKDSADYYFSQIQLSDPKSPYTGLVQVMNLLNTGNKTDGFSQLEKVNKQAVSAKDVNLLIEIASVRYEAGDTAGWIQTLNQASVIDRKNPKPYIRAGEIYQLMGKDFHKQNDFIGLASGRFEQALYNAPENTAALTHQSEIFVQGGNYREAQEYLDRIIGIDSNYIPALKIYGELAYTLGKYDKASRYYGKYIRLGEYNDKELARYINILYFNKEYAAANQLITPALKKDPKNAVMLRLNAYTSYELGKYAEGLEAIKSFFEVRNLADTNKIITSDYEYAGKLYSKNGNDTEAVVYFRKAVELDATRSDLFEDIAKIYEKQKNYPLAVEYYNQFINSRKGDVASSTYFSMGKDLLLIANESITTADSVNRPVYLKKAGDAFSKVIEISPASHLGYQWHARVLAALDPETTSGLAKPDYEKALEIIEQKPDLTKYKTDLIEIYRYLGYYYYLQFETAKQAKDAVAAEAAKAESLKYWNKVLELDPANEVATQAVKALK